MGQYRWPDFRGIVSVILGGILSQILTHFARLKILFWFGWLFFGSESTRRDILASFIRTRLVRDIITFNGSLKSRDQSSSIEYHCVWLPTPPSPRLPQGPGGCVSGEGELIFAVPTRLTARVRIGGLRVLPIENHLAKLC